MPDTLLCFRERHLALVFDFEALYLVGKEPKELGANFQPTEFMEFLTFFGQIVEIFVNDGNEKRIYRESKTTKTKI